jgi:hypothetical protein
MEPGRLLQVINFNQPDAGSSMVTLDDGGVVSRRQRSDNRGLGDKVAAFAVTEQAKAALPMERDAVSGPRPLEILARVAAQLGEADRALAALQKLMATSYSGALGPGAPLTPALLRPDLMFDRLRGDPRFQELCKDKQP